MKLLTMPIAAASFVATMGISDDLIQSTIKEVDDELQSNEQSTGTQRTDRERGSNENVSRNFPTTRYRRHKH